MSMRMFPILLLAMYGCSEKDLILAPSAPQHYLEVSAPVISICRPGPSKPFVSIQKIDTVVIIKFSVSADDDPQVVAWALGPLAYKRVFDYDWDVWESKYVSIPCPAKKATVEFGPDFYIEGQRFRSGTATISKCDVMGVTVVASWSNGPLKHVSVMLK